MIDKITQILKSLRATDRMMKVVRDLYDCNTSTELEEFVAKNFKQDKTTSLVVTLDSTLRLNENIPSDVAAFLHFFKRFSDEAIASGYESEGSLMMQLHDKLLSFCEQTELFNLANWILNEVQKRSEDSEQLSAFVLSEIDRMNDDLFQAIRTVVERKKKTNLEDAKEIEDAAKMLKVTFREVRQREMKKNAAYTMIVANRSASISPIKLQELKSLSPVESIGFLIGQRIENNFKSFTPREKVPGKNAKNATPLERCPRFSFSLSRQCGKNAKGRE
ncbi:MAG: hypothetical protein JSV88_30190 [Candidatus Aminicenantes bacterium]|nr:MAG: hypothetical protein JSV88_30190 [Candidatus Aminicenantes bacterium]